jgi:hypothetical protein
MPRRMLPLVVLMAAVAAPVSIHAEPPLTLRSVKVELPASEKMFPGPGADAVNNNCLACHSADMVLNQPAMPKATWQAVVDKMRTAYKAPIDAKDVDAILAYLVRLKGSGS